MLDLLRLREFRAFMVANCVERVASGAMTVLFGYQIYAITHHPLDLGWLGLAEAIPGVTLVLYGGHIADRHSRRRVALLCTALLGVLALAIALLSRQGPRVVLPSLIAIAFLAGVVRAFENPAVTGLEAQVVPLQGLMRGVALLATSGRLADVAGPVLAGFAWAALGPSGTYAAIAGLFALATLAVLLGVAERPPPEDAQARDAAAERVWPRIMAGIRYVFRDQVLVGSMALDLFAVFFGGATALLPAFATDVLHAGPVGFGLLRGAIGAGALAAALLSARLLPQRQAGWALHAVIGGFGLSMVVFGVSRSLPISLAALFVAGLCDGTSVVIRRAILRLCSPEALRGRISAVRQVFIGSSNELGAFESGMLASLLGTTAAVWSGGLVTLAIVAVTLARMPALRRLDLVALAEATPEQHAAALPGAAQVAA